MPDDAPPDDGNAASPTRRTTLGPGATRVFVIAFLLLIVGVAVGSTYYLLSTARAALEEAPAAGPDSTQTDTLRVETAPDS